MGGTAGRPEDKRKRGRIVHFLPGPDERHPVVATTASRLGSGVPIRSAEGPPTALAIIIAPMDLVQTATAARVSTSISPAECP